MTTENHNPDRNQCLGKIGAYHGVEQACITTRVDAFWEPDYLIWILCRIKAQNERTNHENTKDKRQKH